MAVRGYSRGNSKDIYAPAAIALVCVQSSVIAGDQARLWHSVAYGHHETNSLPSRDRRLGSTDVGSGLSFASTSTNEHNSCSQVRGSSVASCGKVDVPSRSFFRPSLAACEDKGQRQRMGRDESLRTRDTRVPDPTKVPVVHVRACRTAHFPN